MLLLGITVCISATMHAQTPKLSPRPGDREGQKAEASTELHARTGVQGRRKLLRRARAHGHKQRGRGGDANGAQSTSSGALRQGGVEEKGWGGVHAGTVTAQQGGRGKAPH